MAVTIRRKCIFSQSEKLHFQTFQGEHSPGLPVKVLKQFWGYLEAPRTLNSSHGRVLRPPKINFLTMQRTFDNRIQDTSTQRPK